MSRFSAASKRMNARVYAHIGDEAMYTPKSTGVPKKTEAIIHRDVESFPGSMDSAVTQKETHISFPKKDIKNPRKGDKIMIDGERYIVDDLADFGNTGESVRVIVK